MRDEQRDQPRSVFAPYVNERHCSNCSIYSECWPASNDLIMQLFPPRFVNRGASWNERRLDDYMKRIYGGICGNFVMNHHNVDLNKMDIDKQWDK